MTGASVPRIQVDEREVEKKFFAAWSQSDALFELIKDGDFLSKPIIWRHPFIFYVGHLPAFTWNQICDGILNWTSFNPYFDDLFCRGIDPDIDTGECHWHPDVPDRWPDLMQVLDYRDRVREAVLESLDVVPRIYSNDIMARNGRVFEMVLEHEYMHQETLLYMMQELPIDKKNRPDGGVRYSFEAPAPSHPIVIAAGKARLGARFENLHFGWDNEFSEVTVEVPEFAIDSMAVTNGAFFDFVKSGAYGNQRHWRPADWDWKRRTQREHPNFWSKEGGAWFYHAMFDRLPLAQVAGWPVYVTLAEARAYASWRGKRLPTEAEFHRAAFGGPGGDETRYPWGEVSPAPRHGNFNFTSWSPTPVGSCPAGVSRWGVGELFGNGWEWTDTPFAPFSGFTPYMTNYRDYSTDFFDGKHFVLKGASWATAPALLRPSFRNWYQVHYPHVFAKFRCVSDNRTNEP